MEHLYGKEKDVSFLAINLLWGYGGELYEIRFVLVVYLKVTSILAATDLTMSAEEVIELYAKKNYICFKSDRNVSVS